MLTSMSEDEWVAIPAEFENWNSIWKRFRRLSRLTIAEAGAAFRIPRTINLLCDL